MSPAQTSSADATTTAERFTSSRPLTRSSRGYGAELARPPTSASTTCPWLPKSRPSAARALRPRPPRDVDIGASHVGVNSIPGEAGRAVACSLPKRLADLALISKLGAEIAPTESKSRSPRLMVTVPTAEPAILPATRAVCRTRSSRMLKTVERAST
eukprot:5127743-Pleurochrysis_carterae.AAC.2